MSQPVRILLALAAGLVIGVLAAKLAWPPGLVAVAEPVGGLWLDALRMTIIPLIVSLLVIGIAASAEAARASRLAGRAVLLYMALLWVSAILAALLIPLLLKAWPMPGESAAKLKSVLSASAGHVGEIPTVAQFVSSIVPTNPIAAAAGDQILQLIVFTTAFAFAITRLAEAPRAQLVAFFRAIADAMLVIVNWVLWIAPIGVFALAYVVGARAGGTAFGALFHYVVTVSSVGFLILLLSWPFAMVFGRVGPVAFARAIGPSYAVAISTQSSLASLPAMLRGSERLGVPVAASGVTLPLAVALFRATGPAMNMAVAIYVATWFGIHLGPAQLAAGVAVAALTSLGAVSLPGSISYISSIAPICLAIGVPIEPLVLFVAIEPIPDLFRTVGNVSMDVATTATLARSSGFAKSEAAEEDRLLEAGA